ncbi:MAG: cold-shock protein [Deltaproteobacteria bacterium]|nr:cold-shock protein [Deltaproteobacteria bacterium]
MSNVEGVRFEDLREGQRVSFDEGQGPKGPRAENARPLRGCLARGQVSERPLPEGERPSLRTLRSASVSSCSSVGGAKAGSRGR